MKLWGTCLGDRVGQPRHIFQVLLHIGNEAGPREAAKLEKQSYLSSFKPKCESGLRTTGFGACHAGFWSCLRPLFSHYALIIPFGIGMYFLYHWLLELFFVFVFSGVMDKRLPWVLEETLDVWTVVRLLESMVTSEIGPNAFCIMRLALSLQGPGTECGHLSFMRRCDTGIFRLGKFILKSSNLLQNIDEWGGLMLHTPTIEIVR